MEKELWKKYQDLIDAGLTELIVDALVKEVSDNLTTEQFKPLGDLRSAFLKMFPSTNGVTAELMVAHIIDLARQGVIHGRNADPQ